MIISGTINLVSARAVLISEDPALISPRGTLISAKVICRATGNGHWCNFVVRAVAAHEGLGPKDKDHVVATAATMTSDAYHQRYVVAPTQETTGGVELPNHFGLTSSVHDTRGSGATRAACAA